MGIKPLNTMMLLIIVIVAIETITCKTAEKEIEEILSDVEKYPAKTVEKRGTGNLEEIEKKVSELWARRDWVYRGMGQPASARGHVANGTPTSLAACLTWCGEWKSKKGKQWKGCLWEPTRRGCGSLKEPSGRVSPSNTAVYFTAPE